MISFDINRLFFQSFFSCNIKLDLAGFFELRQLIGIIESAFSCFLKFRVKPQMNIRLPQQRCAYESI